MRTIVILLALTLSACIASHEPCEAARLHMRDLSCVEGYGTPAEFAPVCEIADAECILDASDCTEARACRR